MLLLKPGVRITGLRPEIVIALLVAERAYAEAGYELMVTSGIEGAHSLGSLHYAGSAVDLRSLSVPPEKLKPLVERIRGALGPDFDVVLEKTHLHVEHQPKQPLSNA